MGTGGPSQRQVKAAFTLLELLVVVVIVLLLIAILLPTLGKAKATGRGVVCLNHLKGLVLATTAYRDEHAGWYPQPREDDDLPVGRYTAVWFNAVDPYMALPALDYDGTASKRNHSAAKQDPAWQQSIPAAVRAGNRTIKMNDAFGAGSAAGAWRFVRECQISRCSLTVMYADGRAADYYDSAYSNSAFYVTEGWIGLRHGSGANVAFADGHCRLVVQAIRTDTAAPSWFAEPDTRQTLVWGIR